MLLEGAPPIQVEYTNYGFYVAVKHSLVGKERRVYSDPDLIAHSDGREASFVAFLEDDHLKLEIVPSDGESLPATFREGNIILIENPFP
jgi:hypothetical protein